MSNSYFQFKQFTIHQDRCAMKVTTDGCLFGAWVAERISSRQSGARSQSPIVCKVLDIGTGTGLLSLMLAQKNPELKMDAVEMDEEAAKQAVENINTSPWKEKINMIQADARTLSYSRKYDCIISNPPFYENELKGDDKKRNIAHHNEGLLLPELLSIIRNNLAAGGRFYLLLPYKRNEEIRKLLLQYDLAITEIVFVRQSVKHEFFRIMLSGKSTADQTTEITIDEIAVWNEKQQYTHEFISLLKDYYLYL